MDELSLLRRHNDQWNVENIVALRDRVTAALLRITELERQVRELKQQLGIQ